MNYGLPYKGSKNRIAKRLGALLPSAEKLYRPLKQLNQENCYVAS